MKKILFATIVIAILTLVSCTLRIDKKTFEECLDGDNQACHEATKYCDDHDDKNACYATGIAWGSPGSGFSPSLEPSNNVQRQSNMKIYLRKACREGHPTACQRLKNF